MWDRYGRIVLGVVGGIAVIGAIAFLMMRSRSAAENQAAGQLAEASALYWQGDYARSLTMSKQIYQQYSGAPSGIEAHRLAGDNAYWSGDYKTAITEYQAYLGKVKTGVLADAARRSLAYAYESDRQYGPAATTFESLVGKFDRESSAEFLMAAARNLRAQNKPAEARQRLQRLVDEFGETSVAPLVRIELAEQTPPATP
jgi:TolA-binding protein